MGRRKNKRKKKQPEPVPLKKNKFQEISVEKHRYPLRSYETCHDKFLDYDGIKEFLRKIQRNYPQKVQIQVIGKSRGGRSIFMVIISGAGPSQQPKMATIIEAGSNGDEWLSVSSALFMIDFLAKNQNLVKIMDYFIIPCSNPDAYESSLTNKHCKSKISMYLSNNFPILLGTCDMRSIRTEDFLMGLKEWKENYECNAPETLAVIRTIATYQFATKMFISLQGEGTSITYPFGFCEGDPMDVEDLLKVAKAGQQGVRSRCFEVGSIYHVSGLTYGSIIDFLRTNRSSIKFTYVIHVNKKQRRLEAGKILCYGQEIMNCVRFMSRNVYMFYTHNQNPINPCKSSFNCYSSRKRRTFIRRK